MTKITHGRRAYCVVAVALGALLCARTSTADTLTLLWDPNTEPQVEGYRVYVGTQSRKYSQTIDVQNSNTYVFSSAVPGQLYCFAVLAYAGSIVSPLSDEACGRSNDYPTLSNPGNQTGRVGQVVSLQLSASDPDGAPIAYSVSGLPAGLTLSKNLGTISGTPTAAGAYTVAAQASDGALSVQQSFAWVIQSANQNASPTLVNPGSQMNDKGRQILLQLQAADADGGALTYSASGLPLGLQVSSVNGLISGTPRTAGTFTVTAKVSDGRATASQSFGWTIRGATVSTDAPTLTVPDDQTTRAINRPAPEKAKLKGTVATARPEPGTTQLPVHSMTGSQATLRPSSDEEAATTYTGTFAVTRPVAAPHAATATTSTVVTRSILRAPAGAPTLTGGSADADVSETLALVSSGTPATETSPRLAVSAPGTAPKITIETPVSHESFAAGSVVIFMGTARDALGADLTDAIVWTSSRDGRIGTGGLLHKELTSGTHVITASVTGSRGATKSAKTTVVVLR